MERIQQSVALAPAQCPKCKAPQNRATIAPGQRTPHAGDICLCSECQALCFFTDELGHLRAATWEDIRQLKKTPQLFDKICTMQRELRAAKNAANPGTVLRRFRK